MTKLFLFHMWAALKQWLLLVERHKDLVDAGIKILGVLGTLGAGVWVVGKFFADRKEARLAKELEIKRGCYLDMFTSFPKLSELVGQQMGSELKAMVVPPEFMGPYVKLSILASPEGYLAISDVLKIFSASAPGLASLHIAALEADRELKDLESYRATQEAKILGDPKIDAFRKAAAMLSLQTDYKHRHFVIQDRRTSSWDALATEVQRVIAELSGAFRRLIIPIRKDIGASSPFEEVLIRIEADEPAMRKNFGASLDFFRKQHGLGRYALPPTETDNAFRPLSVPRPSVSGAPGSASSAQSQI